jgi:23S rRNA U2552 (ribose-2'-O)-methylase RlmE/FtsJ
MMLWSWKLACTDEESWTAQQAARRYAAWAEREQLRAPTAFRLASFVPRYIARSVIPM